MRQDGRIKATYVELYNGKRDKLFSMQRSDFGNKTVVTTDAALNTNGVPVNLTSAAAAIIEGLVSEQHYKKILDAQNAGDLYVKPETLKWWNVGKTAAVGAAALLLLSMFKTK